MGGWVSGWVGGVVGFGRVFRYSPCLAIIVKSYKDDTFIS